MSARPRPEDYRAQHKRRLSWMPWLYFSLKPEHRAWAEAWQAEVQARLQQLETVEIAAGAFVSPKARIFAEPGRPVIISAGASIAAHAFIHGPVTIGPEVSINARAAIDGGRAGVRIGRGTRIGSGATIYAFDHGMAADRPIRGQPVVSRGVTIGEDVWIGAQAGVTDGVELGDHSVAAMGAVVAHSVPPWVIVGGVPAKPIGDRRDKR